MAWIVTEKRKAYWESMRGKPHGHKTSNGGGWSMPEEGKEKLSLNHNPRSNKNLTYSIPKGSVPWNKGIGGNKCSWEAKRRSIKKNSFDATTDFKKIEKFYLLAENLTEKIGVKYSVDHIKPLIKGGKHHQDNLQVITLSENLRKKDKYPFEVVERHLPDLTNIK